MNEYNKRFENFCTQIRSSAKGKTPLDLLSELDLALEEAQVAKSPAPGLKVNSPAKPSAPR